MSAERPDDQKHWQEAQALLGLIERLTQKEPSKADQALIQDLGAAAASCVENIVQAHERPAPADRRRFLDIALRSCKEVQSHLCVALDHAYLDRAQFEEADRQAGIVADLLRVTLAYLNREGDRRLFLSRESRQGMP
jgi:four helix bundle protein